MKLIVIGLAALSIFGCASKKTENHPPRYDEIVVNGEAYNPLKVVQPRYPAKAASNRLSGQCIVEFTITKEGSTKDHSVSWSSSPIFDQSCVNAAEQIVYPPLLVDGNPVEVTNVKYSFFLQIKS